MKYINKYIKFFENETLSSGELNLDKKESFWNGNSLYTLPKILNKVRDNSSNDTSDLSVIQIKSLSLDKKSTLDLTKTFKKNSSKPFLNVFYLNTVIYLLVIFIIPKILLILI